MTCGTCSVRMVEMPHDPPDAIRALYSRPAGPPRATSHAAVIAPREPAHTPAWQRAEGVRAEPQRVDDGGRIPRRLRRSAVAAALDITPRQAGYLMASERLPSRQPFGGAAWRFTTPQELLQFALDNDYGVDWGAVLEVHNEADED